MQSKCGWPRPEERDISSSHCAMPSWTKLRKAYGKEKRIFKAEGRLVPWHSASALCLDRM